MITYKQTTNNLYVCEGDTNEPLAAYKTMKHRSNWRQQIYARDNHTCVYCGSVHNLSLDHIIPQSWFVDPNEPRINSRVNLLTACQSCNSRRGNKTIKDFMFSAGLGEEYKRVRAYINKIKEM